MASGDRGVPAGMAVPADGTNGPTQIHAGTRNTEEPPPAPQDPSEEGGVGGGSVLIRIHVPELNINKCLQFARDELVWNVKQQCLAALPKELRESFNYGLFAPPTNGKAGKFLDEERRLTDYPFSGPVGYLELKYKRRVYKMLHLDEKQLKALHTRANLRRLLDYVANRQVEKVAKMCSKGLDPNFHCAETGETPLTLAAATPRSSKVLLALVNGGALIDYRTRDGTTAVHRAVERNNFEALKTLLDLGASPNYKDARGLTPLYLAMTPNTDPMLCEALLHDHAVIGAQDTQGWQEVHQACRHGLVQHLEHLLFYGADMNARNASGNTPLHVCAVNSQESCLRLLLFRGADKEALNFANQTPYQVAVIAGNLELAETIQKHRTEEVDKSLLDQCDIISDSSGVGTSNSGGSAGSGGYDTGAGAGLLIAGVTAVCVENYSSNTSGHLCLTQGDIVEVTGATDCGLLEGTSRGRSGLFPAHCVQEVRLRQGTATLRVQGRRETNLKHFATAPRVKKPLPAEPRTVVLHRSRKGFGFVLRGAKATSPLMELTPSERCPALQYLDDVDAGGVADVAGLRKGDYLLEINGEDVSQASHEHVVDLIRRSGDLVAMRVVSLGEAGVTPGAKAAAATLPSRQCQTLPRKGTPLSRNPAPLPPRRDPKTTLSVGRARARSLVAELDGGSHHHQRGATPADLEEVDSEEPSLSANTTKSSSTESVQARGTPPRTASIRARPTSSRITAAELEELFARQGPAPPSPAGGSTPRTPRVYASVAEMKRSRGKHGRHLRGGVMDSLHKAFSSTPDLAHLSPSHSASRTWSARGARSQEDISWWTQTSLSSGHIGTTLMNGTREYGHAWRSMERLHTEHEAVTRSLSQRTRSLPRNRSSGPPPPPTHPPPPPPVGQVVRVEVAPRGKGTGSDYANIRELPAGQPDARNGRGTPTSPEPIMSSFRPGPAKLYACPEDVKPVAYRGTKGTANRREGGKGRSQSLPPSGARPQVRRHSKGDGGSTPGASSPGYSSFKPSEASPAASAQQPGAPPSPTPTAASAGEGTPHNPYAQPFQHAASTTPVAAPPIPEPDYSMSEDESEDGEEVAKVQRRSSSRKSSEGRGSNNSAAENAAGPLSPGARSSPMSPNGPLSPTAARSSPLSPVFKDLLAQKVAERQTRMNGAGTPADENPPASPSLSTQDIKQAAESSSSNSEQPTTNGNGNGGHLPHSFSVEEIQKVKTQLKSSKSYPNDFSQEDGDNSSSGVSSDQDTQPEPAAVVAESPCQSPPKLANQSPAQPPAQANRMPAQGGRVAAQGGRPPTQPGRIALNSPSQPHAPRFPAQGAASPQQATSAFNKPESSDKRTWQPDGKEASPGDQPDPTKGRRKSEEITRRSGTLTRHAVSLVQLPPPQETDGEGESQSGSETPSPAPTQTHRPTKSVTFMTQDRPHDRSLERQHDRSQERMHERAQERLQERERMQQERDRMHERTLERTHEKIQGPIQATKLIMPNHRQPIPSAHLRQSVPSQRSRSTDVDTGRPVEVERSIEESLQLIQRHVEQLSLVVPPPPEFDGARMAAAAAAAAHAHHYHHHHHHPSAIHPGHPMHASFPGHPGHPIIPNLPNLQPTLPQIQDGHPPHPGAFPVGHPLHPGFNKTQQQQQQQQQAQQSQERPPHHSHLYHLHPPPDEPLLVAPPPEFSDTGEPHKMTIRVGASSPGAGTLQRLTPAQQAEIMRQRQLEEIARQRHMEELNRQRAEVIRQQQQQQQQKTVRIVGTVPKKAPSK